MQVSVIVPVYNPGADIDELIRTVLAQTLPRDAYEVIFVDDGSTDATPARLDALARAHTNVRVVHEPNSGWPGRPRNIGLDLARGEYVLFVDHDDWLSPTALEHWHAAAVDTGADVVVGKVVGHGRGISRSLFTADRRDVTLAWEPLVTMLTPHKLFRRRFLVDHAIRFAEGPRRLEDHLFVMEAYFRARSIAVLASHPCYHWARHAHTASDRRIDPPGYYGNLREVLDLIERHTAPGALRDQLFTHWYRSKLLGRAGGGKLLRRAANDPAYDERLIAEIRRLARDRFGPAHEARLAFNLRVRSRLLRAGDHAGLCELATFETQLRARATAEVGGDDQGVVLRLEAALEGAAQPLRFERDGATVRWVPPPALLDRLPAEALDVTDDLAAGTSHLLLRRGALEYPAEIATRTRLDSEGLALQLAETTVRPDRAAAGAPLPRGTWSLRMNVFVAGFHVGAAVRDRATGRPLRLVVDEGGRAAVELAPPPAPGPPPARKRGPAPPPSIRLKRRVKRLARGAARLVRPAPR